MIDFAGCADSSGVRPSRIPLLNGNQLVTMPSVYTRGTLYTQSTASRHGINILTSNYVLHLVLTASGLTDDVWMCILGHIVGGFIGSVAVDKQVSAFWLCAKMWCIVRGALWSACFGSVATWQRCLCIQGLVVWSRRGRWQWTELGSHEEYMVRFMSEWNKKQPTCTLYSSRILLLLTACCRGFPPSRDLQ